MSRTIPFFRLTDHTDQAPSSATPEQSCLVRIYPPSASGSLIELHSPRMTIGRDALCDLELEDDFVSRVHAVLELIGDQWRLTDHGSLNGTFVNDRRIEEHSLSSGDEIHIGNHFFRFLCSDHLEAQYHEAVYQMMTIDALTEMHNRRFFEDSFRREMLRAVRRRRSLMLLLLDIDHFKRINDEYGHLVGDEVLRALSARLRARVRGDEILARFGGEEFAIALPEVSVESGVAVAEEFRRLACESPIETSRGPVNVTLSIGAAHFDGQSRATGEELLQRADEKLYAAKRAGRNRVMA